MVQNQCPQSQLWAEPFQVQTYPNYMSEITICCQYSHILWKGTEN